MARLLALRNFWIVLCEMIDAGRLVPRALLAFHMYVTLKVTLWAIVMEKRSAEDVALVLGLVGLFVPFMKWYLENGTDWATDPRAARISRRTLKRASDASGTETDRQPAP